MSYSMEKSLARSPLVRFVLMLVTYVPFSSGPTVKPGASHVKLIIFPGSLNVLLWVIAGGYFEELRYVVGSSCKYKDGKFCHAR